MNIELTEKQMDAIAVKTARKVIKLLNRNLLNRDEQPKLDNKKKYVDINTAANILGYSISHLRQIKDQFPHIKRGGNQQGRLLFEEDALYESFNK